VNKAAWLCAAVLGSITSATATAAPAAWCKGEKTDFNGEDVRTLQSGEPDEVLKSLAEAQCASGADVDAHRAEIDKAIAIWPSKTAKQPSMLLGATLK
jgi:hypothetical protein